MIRRDVQVPMYQPRIPIGGGGGNIDLTEDPRAPNPIVQALQMMVQQKRQREQDKLTGGEIVTGEDGNTYFVLPNGEVKPLTKPDGTPLKGPKSEAGKKVTDELNEMAKASKSIKDIPESVLEPGIADEIMRTRRRGVMDQYGLEEFDIPGEKRSRLGMDWLARDVPPRKEIRKKPKFPPPTEFLRTQELPAMRRELAEAQIPTARKRKRVESKVVTKERPPKPKEYPDAKWNDEHQCWTIVKNGRLMGVK